jgi:phage terminase large subunit-like protein
MTIGELADKFGGFENIPHADLYRFLCLPETRDALTKLVKPYRDRIQEAAESKDKEQKEFLLKAAAEKLEEFKKHPFIASVRKRCKSDLTWLACYFCWESNPEGVGRPIEDNCITPESHGPILSLFVKKDDSKKLKDQDKKKIRLLLWPRGGQKSTIDVVDGVQWILNFPEIRILYLGGDVDLAKGFIRETKGHFLECQESTLMNLFFPEFCVNDKQLGNEFEFDCPVYLAKTGGQRVRKEPTVWATSVGSGMGGRHAEVVKSDDAVYDGNSANEDICKNVSKKIDITVRPGKVLRFYGYLDLVGTRYNEYDYYGEVIDGDKKDGEITTTTGRCWTLTENEKSGLQILIGRAIVIKPEVVQRLEKEGRPVNYIEAGEEGCDLLLPDTMPYSRLMGEYTKNEEAFEGQFNQNPRAQGSVTFDRPLLLRNTVRFDELPFSGPISQTWDFAGPFNKEKRGDRDYCTASNAVWDNKGNCYITELIRNRYKPADLAKAVVDFARKYHPFIIGIEDCAGSRWLEPQIKLEAQKTGIMQVIDVCNRIDWIAQDNQKGAKKLRMAALHPWFTDGRMKLAHFLLNGQIGVVYDEFERCLHGKGHDDIPDVISRQVLYAPRVNQMAAKEASNPLFGMPKDRAAFNLLYEPGTDAFGRIGFGPPPEPIVEPEPDPDLTSQPMYPNVLNPLGAGW